MRQLVPTPIDPVDPYDAYRPDDASAPLLRLNMVTSLDGSAVDEHGRSGGLGGEGDRELFRTLRAHADGILVGAGTARIEGYGPHRMMRRLADRRAADGRGEPAAIVIVTRSMQLDFDNPLFVEAATPTVIVTCAAAPANRLAHARSLGPVVVAGDREVDVATALAALRRDLGLAHLLCEGGPTLNRQLFDADLVDELCLTLAPALVGGPGPRLAREITERRDFRLLGALEEGGEVFLRYSRR